MALILYRLGEEIGRGAVGRVVRIHDDAGGATYAGKILHSSHQGDAHAFRRFTSEAAILAEVHDDNIVRVFGIETIEGLAVMRMELVEGPDLAKLLALEGPLASDRIIAIASQLASGLRAAHIAGLVHRDLKPQNILLTAEEIPKIADFGMARAASFAGVDESAFAVAGTPDYMGPECVDPLAVDARSDLYSLGCILFEMATGTPPFMAATSFAVLEAHRTAPIPPIAGDYPDALIELIYALLAKSPADRPQSAAAVARRLQEMSDGASTALAILGTRDLAATGQCASCGQTLIPVVPVCFACAAPRVVLKKGQHSLFVVGPGEIGDKLDTQLREKLLKWLEANPALGLDPAPLAKNVPRLPFVVVTKASEASAAALAQALEQLGLQCTALRGGTFRLPALRKKSWLLARRLVAIGAGSSIGLHTTLGMFLVPIIGVGLVAGVAGGFVLAGKSITKKSSVGEEHLPEAVAASIAGVAIVVESMSLRRHRDNLRGVVERVLSLCKSLTAAALAECESDLARLVDMALIACNRMDEIEVAIAGADMRNLSEETLALMRERDRWAGRLLEVTAFLDSMRAHTVALQHAGPEARRSAERIDELRAHVAALEEVQNL